MALYHKKLHSLQELKKERKLLLKKRRKLDKEPLLSLDGIAGAVSGGGGVLGTVLDLLPISNPLVKMGMKMAGKLFTKKDADKKKDEPYDGNKKTIKGRIGSALLDVGLGYLKWKAVSLSYKAAKSVVKSRKEKQADY